MNQIGTGRAAQARRRRFAFDEVHGHEDSSSVNKDYFFMHPAFKEWILTRPEQWNKPFERLQTGIIDDLAPFEAMPPLLRLGVVRGQVSIKLRTERRMAIAEKGATSDPLRLLFVALWACRELKQTRINVSELRQVWSKLRGIEQIKSALQVALPHQVEDIAQKFWDWAKKINRDQDIQPLQRTLTGVDNACAVKMDRRTIAPRESFISVSSRSAMGAQVELWFSNLPLDELDWDETLHSVVSAAPRVASIQSMENVGMPAG